MLILAVETSCDETAVSVVKMDPSFTERPEILSELISSQTALHELYGGVVPELASREHLKNLPFLYQEALKKAAITPSQLDGFAVTRGPGLKGCLLIGINFVKALHLALQKPFIGVNHIEGHILSPLLTKKINFPYLALVVSGGHTELHLVEGVGRYRLLGRTSDDAAGEAFDKSASLLGIPYPGGAKLAALADDFGKSTFSLPRVMREAKGFSFSGLKTAISMLIKKQGELTESSRADIASAVQASIVDALVFKVRKAIDETGVRDVAIVGGVAANKCLRELMEKSTDGLVHVPAPVHCTDNASMICIAGAFRLKNKEQGELSEGPLPRWPVETLSAYA